MFRAAGAAVIVFRRSTNARAGAAVALPVALVIACSLQSAACRQVIGIESEPPPRDSVLACGVPFANETCAQCMTASCCDQAAKCKEASGGGCSDLASCTATCIDSNCETTCRTRFPSGYGAEASALQTCKLSRCERECESLTTTCGGYIFSDPECGGCSAAKCCEPAAACMRDAECTAVSTCERQCANGDDDCLTLCELAHRSGVAKQRAFGTCIYEKCPTSCISRTWSCLKPTGGPAAKPNDVTATGLNLTYTLVDYETYTPIAGLKLNACNANDLDCLKPLNIQESLTDVNGRATIHLNAGVVQPFVGFIEINGDGYPTVLLYVSTPIAKDFAAPTTLLPTSVAFNKVGNAVTHDQLDPQKSTVIVSLFDCARSRAGGVALSILPRDGVTPFYFIARQASADVTVTDSSYGVGGFANVQTTAITIDAKVVENGVTFPSAVVGARKDALTFVLMFASP